MEAGAAVFTGDDAELFPERFQLVDEMILDVTNLFVILTDFSPRNDDSVRLLRRLDDELNVGGVRFEIEVFFHVEFCRHF